MFQAKAEAMEKLRADYAQADKKPVTVRAWERDFTAEQKRSQRGRRRRNRKLKTARKAAAVNNRPQNPRHSTAYTQRLASPEWKLLKLTIIAKRGNKCERCNKSGHLDLHHKTYKNLGHEPETDLELLCRICHDEQHGLILPSRHKRLSKRRTAHANSNQPNVGTGLRTGRNAA